MKNCEETKKHVLKKKGGYPNAIEEYQSFCQGTGQLLEIPLRCSSRLRSRLERKKHTLASQGHKSGCRSDIKMAVSCDLNAIQLAYELTINHGSDLDL